MKTVFRSNRLDRAPAGCAMLTTQSKSERTEHCWRTRSPDTAKGEHLLKPSTALCVDSRPHCPTAFSYALSLIKVLNICAQRSARESFRMNLRYSLTDYEFVHIGKATFLDIRSLNTYCNPCYSTFERLESSFHSSV